jgi:NADH dehydrogenase FAD-containing subunit
MVSGGVPAEGKPIYTAEMVELSAEAPRTLEKAETTETQDVLARSFLVNRRTDGQRKVIVVGGGFSGLSAAYELESLWIQCDRP